jgi:hypothetical protein
MGNSQMVPILLGLALTGCSAENIGDAALQVDTGTNYVHETPSWDEFMASVRVVDRDRYFVEGDILVVGEDELFAYYEREYLGKGDKSIIDFTTPGTRNKRGTRTRIGYCYAAGWGTTITQDTNGDGDTTDLGEVYVAPASPQGTVEAAMAQWEHVANVNFVLMTPATCSNAAAQPAGVSFVITHYFDNGTGTASGAFPDWQWSLQALLVPTGGLNSVNWAAHEIGHILGFRHEQIHSGDPSSGAFCSEDTTGDGTNDVDDVDFDELTSFDTNSTMKYAGCGSQAVSLVPVSGRDGMGARAVYGPPPSWFVPYGLPLIF